MAGAVDTQRIIANLREQVDQLRNERDNYRRLYDAEVVENEDLARIRKNLRANYQALLNQNNRLRERIQGLKEEFVKYHPKMYRKNWNDASAQTKRKRTIEYRSVFDSAMQIVPECKKAKLSLAVGNNRLKFKWSPEDLSKGRETMRQKGFPVRDPPPIESDDASETDDPTDTRSREFVHEQIIHVMDRYRISQDAYHELQQTLKKLSLPPMHYLKKQKKKMSEEIPFEKYPNVSSYPRFYFFQRCVKVISKL